MAQRIVLFFFLGMEQPAVAQVPDSMKYAAHALGSWSIWGATNRKYIDRPWVFRAQGRGAPQSRSVDANNQVMRTAR